MSATLKTILTRFWPIITFVLATIWWMNTKINTSIFIDNDMFRHALDHSSLLSFLHTRYMTWSGRLFIEAALAETLRFSLFWKLLIPACMLLLAWSIWSTTLQPVTPPSVGIPLVTLLILLFPKEMNNEAIYWLAGFYNYLFPISFACFSIAIFVRQRNTTLNAKALSVLALPVGCSIEQSSLLLLICTGLCTIRMRATSAYSKAYLTLAGFLSAVLFLAPGNRHRYFAEIGNWMPDYPRLDNVQKLSLAVDRIHRMCIQPDNIILLVALLVSILFLALKRTVRTFQDILAIAIMSLNALLILPSSIRPTGILDILRSDRFLFDGNWASLSIYLSFFLTLAMFTSLLWCALSLTEAASVMTVLCTALFITLLTGFSPTIYASSDRILFLLEVAFVFYTCAILRDLMMRLSLKSFRPIPPTQMMG